MRAVAIASAIGANAASKIGLRLHHAPRNAPTSEASESSPASSRSGSLSLVREIDHRRVRAVDAFGAEPRRTRTSSEERRAIGPHAPADALRRLEDRRRDAALLQPIRTVHAGEPRTDDRHLHRARGRPARGEHGQRQRGARTGEKSTAIAIDTPPGEHARDQREERRTRHCREHRRFRPQNRVTELVSARAVLVPMYRTPSGIACDAHPSTPAAGRCATCDVRVCAPCCLYVDLRPPLARPARDALTVCASGCFSSGGERSGSARSRCGASAFCATRRDPSTSRRGAFTPPRSVRSAHSSEIIRARRT